MLRKTTLIISVLLSLASGKSMAQVLERASTNSGSSSVFSYSITSAYGVNTSADATANLIVDTEAILNLKEDSYITNKAGDVGGDTSAVITTTPNGSTVSLTGITAENNYLIDEGTSFKAALITRGDGDGQPSKGSAQASASHTMTLAVTNNHSSFYNTLREVFEGAE